MKRNALIKMVQFSILLALEVIMCFTPLGSIPIGPMVATLAMIPVILTGIYLVWEPAQLWDFLQDYLALLYGLSSRPDQLHLFLHRLSPLEIFTATVGALSSVLFPVF